MSILRYIQELFFPSPEVRVARTLAEKQAECEHDYTVYVKEPPRDPWICRDCGYESAANKASWEDLWSDEAAERKYRKACHDRGEEHDPSTVAAIYGYAPKRR